MIQSEISPPGVRPLGVTFHGVEESAREAREKGPQTSHWAQATELGDFVQDAAEDSKFVIAVHQPDAPVQILPVRVPTFKQRTKYLRQRLKNVTQEMQSLLEIKTECDVSLSCRQRDDD